MLTLLLRPEVELLVVVLLLPEDEWLAVGGDVLVGMRIDHLEPLLEQLPHGAVQQDVLLPRLNHGNALTTHLLHQPKQVQVLRQALPRGEDNAQDEEGEEDIGTEGDRKEKKDDDKGRRERGRTLDHHNQ